MVQRKDDETQWRPYMRRINVIELSSSFTSDPNLVGPDKNVFLEDTSLIGFFHSFDSRCCYLQDHILPLMERVSLEDALDVLNNPTEEELETTRKFVAAMVGQSDKEEECGEHTKNDSEELVCRVHEATAHKESFVKVYTLKDIPLIPCTKTQSANGKKASKINNFRQAI